MMRTILLLSALLLSGPAFAQQQPRLPQGAVLENAQDWYGAVSARLQRAGAREVAKAGHEGVVGSFEARVGFTVSADGAVSEVHLAESSGNDAADRVALRLPALAAPFPRFTADMTPEAKTMVAPLQLHFEAPAQPSGDVAPAGE